MPAVRPAVKKSAASAASLDGVLSRDQAGCQRSLPADQKSAKKYEKPKKINLFMPFIEGFPLGATLGSCCAAVGAMAQLASADMLLPLQLVPDSYQVILHSL